jgi:hypothetical protein
MKISLSHRAALAAALSVALAVPFVPTRAMDITERIVSTQTTLIRYEATEYQRKVALANAHAYMKAHVDQPIAKASKSGKSGKSSDSGTKTAKKDLKRKLPRYVAIDTVKDKRAAPGTKKVVMIWDTQSEALVNNDVYDVQKTPAVGSTAQFDTYSAEYVGNGL